MFPEEKDKVEELLADLPDHPLTSVIAKLTENSDDPTRISLGIAFKTLVTTVQTNYLLAMLIVELRRGFRDGN